LKTRCCAPSIIEAKAPSLPLSNVGNAAAVTSVPSIDMVINGPEESVALDASQVISTATQSSSVNVLVTVLSS
jgi:hypothetical protein